MSYAGVYNALDAGVAESLQPLQELQHILIQMLSLFQNNRTMAQEPKLHRVDDLFRAAKRYSKSTEYYNLINFCKRMRHLGPYNAMLANIQMPGARFLLTADEWRRYNRIVKDTAHPIVILMPFSPVDFVFDLSDTISSEPLFQMPDDELLEQIKKQFEPKANINYELYLDRLIHNMALEGISLEAVKMGTQRGASIMIPNPEQRHKVNVSLNRGTVNVSVPAYYFIRYNKDLQAGGQLLSLIHELGHLYCHHLAHPDPSAENSWTKREIYHDSEEFEAESVAQLVCDHFGIDTGNATISYIASYMYMYPEIPHDVSVDIILTASRQIIQMIEHKLNVKDGLLYKNNYSFQKKVRQYDRNRNTRTNRGTEIRYPSLFDNY